MFPAAAADRAGCGTAPIKLVDREHITRSKASEKGLQLGPFCYAAALLLHHVLDAGELNSGVLLCGRNPGVSVNGQRS